MIGSEKQAVWAEKIKSSILGVVESDFKEITTSILIYSAATRTATDEIHLDRLKNNAAILSAWLASANQNVSAEFWIDNKDINSRTILKKHNKEARK